MDWTVIATIIAALGGREFFTWLSTRKSYIRKENANARDVEMTVYEKHIEGYERRLLQRDGKVDALYNELREEQKRNIELLVKINKLELNNEVLTLQKCEKRGCENRKPPGAY